MSSPGLLNQLVLNSFPNKSGLFQFWWRLPSFCVFTYDDFLCPQIPLRAPLLLSSSTFLNDTFLNYHHGTQTWATTLTFLNLFPHLKNLLWKSMRMKLFSIVPDEEMSLIKMLIYFPFTLGWINKTVTIFFPLLLFFLFTWAHCFSSVKTLMQNSSYTLGFTKFHVIPGLS